LEIKGGQTITGYQEGKLIVAWANLTNNPDKGVYGGMQPGTTGCLLLLDELPKLDPNTAGLLNDALAKVKNPNGKIENDRGEKFSKARFYCIATGNAPLNREEPDYVANFKQDLSLQDRFMGSVYEVFVNLRVIGNAMRGFNFIFNYMWSVQQIIQSPEAANRSIPSFGFVSIRIMESLRDSWAYWHQNHEELGEGKIKTLKEGVDSFFGVFLDSQQEYLKEKSNYKNFIAEIKKMEALPFGEVTPEQQKETDRLIAEYNEKIKKARGVS
jgi:cobaltochelatase CobS